MNTEPNISQAIEALKDPALADQNRVLNTVNDEIAASKLAITSYDNMIAEMQGKKRIEKLNLSRLQKRQRIFRKAVFDLASVNEDSQL